MTQPDPDSAPSNPLARLPRWLWLSLAVLIALRAALPIVLEWAIPWVAKREAGADVAIENIDLGLFRGELVVDGLRVASPPHVEASEISEPLQLPRASAIPVVTAEPEADDEARSEPDRDLLALTHLRLEIDWLELLGAHLSLPLIQLDGLTLRLHQNRDGSFALPTPPPPESVVAREESTPSGVIEEAPEEATPPGENEDLQAADSPPAQTAPNEDASEAVESDPGAGEADGWQFSIGRFELTEPDLAVYSERAGGEVARFRLTRFAVDALSAGAAGFGLGDIALEDPEVFIERDWLFDPGLGGGDAAPERDSGPPSIQVARLAISSGHFQIRSPDGPIESAIRIEILRLDTAPGQIFPIEVALDVGEGGVRLNGQLGVLPPSFEGELAWHDLNVPPYLLLTTPAVVPWLASCNAEGRLDVSFRSQAPAQLVLRGESQLSDLVFRHPETGELALEAERLSIQLREAVYPLEAGQPRRVDAVSLEISKPKVVFTNPPDALDELLAIYTEPALPEAPAVDEPAAGDAATPPANPNELPPPEPTAGSALTISIEDLTISDGELVFVDRTVTPRHETRIRDFRLDAAGVTSSPAGAGRIEMAGLIQKKGTFEIKGKLPRGKGSLHFELRGLDLASYNGFARGAGLNLDSGDASLESAIRIVDDRYESKNDLVLHDLRVDATEPGAFASTFGVSLDLALALLRGPRGDIELALPVTFDTAGAGVGMGSLIRSALQSALTGVLTSPFKLVGALLPTGSKAAAPDAIEFEPGESGLSADAKKRIAPLVDLLDDRPGLGITARGQTAPVDGPSLAYAVLRDRAVAGEGLPELEGAGFFARRRLTSALRDRAEGRAGTLDPADEALLSRYVEAQVIPTERRAALARARAQSVVDVLISAGAPAGALTIGPPEDAEVPGVVIDLGLRARAEAPQSE